MGESKKIPQRKNKGKEDPLDRWFKKEALKDAQLDAQYKHLEDKDRNKPEVGMTWRIK